MFPVLIFLNILFDFFWVKGLKIDIESRLHFQKHEFKNNKNVADWLLNKSF